MIHVIETDLITSLRKQLDNCLLPLLDGVNRVALIDFPVHSNIGDSMIWLGQYQFLRDHNIKVAYVGCPNDYSEKLLRHFTTTEDPILILGGGNLGDIWLKEQKLRETVISAFPDRKIIQLPQSIWFNDESNLLKARKIFNEHPNFTLITRDHQSFSIASDKLELKPLLAPDMAFYIKGIKPGAPNHEGIVWLGRSDAEQSDSNEAIFQDPDISYVDWINAPGMPSWNTARWINKYSRFGLQYLTMGLREKTYLKIAEKRLERGIEIVTAGKRGLITERLHGHILALLLDYPHVVLDNSYGKISAFHNAWTKKSETAHFAQTREDAVKIARSL